MRMQKVGKREDKERKSRFIEDPRFAGDASPDLLRILALRETRRRRGKQ